ncbi:MAG: hypothetical protein ACHQ0I_00040 [Candidatus Lutacidiplasmatales archaeon]
MRNVVRVAAYLPVGSSGGSRVAAADEDEFTLAATALERAWSNPADAVEPVVVHALGEFPPMVDWGFAGVLGREVAVIRHRPTASELARALRSLEEGEGGHAVVVTAELPERSSDADPAKPPAPGAAAVAFMLAASNKSRPFSLSKGTSDRSAVSSALRAKGSDAEATPDATFIGDWDVNPEKGRPIDAEATRRAANRDLSARSEGAYVPRPRYIENLPSRWRFGAQECDACHFTTFPARGVCRRCGRRDALTSATLPRDGLHVIATTTIGKGGQPTEFDAQVEAAGPYDVALVEFPNGIRVTLQVTDTVPGRVKVGDTVNTLLRRLYPMEEEWRYGRKAVPVDPSTR